MAFALVHPRELTRSQLRTALPATTIARMMVQGALMGVLPRYDHQGNESGPADPLSVAQRIELADKLLKKCLPDLKTDDPDEAPVLSASTIPTDPEQARRLTTAQIRAAIEADFTAQLETPHGTSPEPVPPVPTPIPPADPSPASSAGRPARKARTRQVPPPQSGGGD